MNQATNTVFLIRPAKFGFNTDTSASNAFQQVSKQNDNDIQQQVLAEFDAFIQQLKENNINVHVFDDSPFPEKPDAIFPNNWVSLHADGKAILYPMCAPNRRHESRSDVLPYFKKNYEVNQVIDLRHYEKKNMFLEGTGSIIFDHPNKLAYACLSERSNAQILNELCEQLGYAPIVFKAYDQNGLSIYHTNVMMCIGSQFTTICLESITNESEKVKVKNALTKNGKTIVDISFDQLNNFTGNMLELKNNDDNSIIVLSASAYKSLTQTQQTTLNACGKLLVMDISTIETIGGGSARCMMAEVFLKHPSPL